MSVQMPLFEKADPKLTKVAARVEELVGAGFEVDKFTENFEVFADALGGTARLRWLVLELAARGQLVPQVPSEGQGSATLTRAQEHVASLVAKGH